MAEPILYKLYDNLYNYADLQRAADPGVSEYVSGLKRGSKDQQQFMLAYSDIMNGIADGTITFSNGRFHDSQGRYRNNTKDRKRDYYGLMASYIYDKMNNTPTYVVQETVAETPEEYNYKTDFWNLLTGGRILDAFAADFRDLGNASQRTAYLLPRIQSFLNNDKLTTDQRALVQTAYDALSSDGFTDDDYMALHNAFGGDFRALYNTAATTLPSKTPAIKLSDGTEVKLDTGDMLSIDYSQGTHSLVPEEIESIAELFDLASDSLLMSAIRTGIREPNGGTDYMSNTFAMRRALNTLYNKHKDKFTELADGVYLIPSSTRTDRQTAFVWDTITKKVEEKSLYDIYQALQNKPRTPKFSTYNKLGGVLKALEGTNLNFATGYDYSDYLDKIFRNQRMIDWMGTHYGDDTTFEKYAKAVKQNVDQRSRFDINDFQNDKKYIGNDNIRLFNTGYQNLGNGANYVLFGNSNDEYNNRAGGITYELAKFNRVTNPNTGDRYNDDKLKAYIDNALGALTYSRVMSLTNRNLDNFGIWGDYWKSKGATGAYYYIAPNDTSGRGLWIPTKDTSIEGYRAFDETPNNQVSPNAPTVERPNSPLSSGVKIPDRIDPIKNPSNIDITNGEKNNPISQIKLKAKGLADVLDPLRLIGTLHSNNSVYKTMKNSIRPYVLNEYELYSPVTGAYSEMQFRNREGADTQRRADRIATADASLNAAQSLQGNRQATEQRYQGFIADDRRIQQTAEAALARQEDNAKRRLNRANSNTELIHNYIREQGQLRADYKKSQWDAIKNYLIELKAKNDAKREKQESFYSSVLQGNEQNALYKAQQTLDAAYKKKYPNRDYYAMATDPAYQNAVRRLQSIYRNKLYQGYAGLYGYNYGMQGEYDYPTEYSF